MLYSTNSTVITVMTCLAYEQSTFNFAIFHVCVLMTVKIRRDCKFIASVKELTLFNVHL